MKKNIFRALTLFTALSFFTSCLKDDSLVLDPSKSDNVIEFANPAQNDDPTAVYPKYTFGFDIKSAVDQTIEVSYSGPKVGAPQDITVNVAPLTDDVAVKAYNDENGTSYTQMPAANYKVNATSVVIKKGQSRASFTITYATDKFDLNKQFVLPLKITSVSSGIISGNYNTILLSVAARNKYDGVYHSTGVFNHPTAGARKIDRDKTLRTVNANTVATEIGDIGGSMNLVVNEADNTVTVVGQVSASQPLIPVAGKTNTYDPTTKTFKLNYQYTGGGGFRVVNEDIKLK